MNSETTRFFNEYVADEQDALVVEVYYEDRERADSDFHGNASYELMILRAEHEDRELARLFGYSDMDDYYDHLAIEEHKAEAAWSMSLP